MNRKEPLTELEQLVLLAVVRLGEDAYGVTIREAIESRTRRPVSITSTYAALDRLEQRRYLRSWTAEPTAVRGGRAKKCFRITKAGAVALRQSQRAMAEMWQGLESHPDLAVA